MTLAHIRTHTHTSCIREVPNADMVVLLIGSRFGGKAVPEALSTVDLDSLVNASFDVASLQEPEKLSITQLEVLKAIEASVPVFAFVEDKVLHDHFVYQKNKELVDQIKFPSIDKADSAKYIFEFISFLQHRNKGNSVIPFSKIEDIEVHLRKQWGALFQKLLREQRDQVHETQKMFTISEQIEDLKTALISTIGNAQSRDVARGVIKYRRLLDFLSGVKLTNFTFITESTIEFDDLLNSAGIVKVTEITGIRSTFGRTALIKEDGTFYEFRFGQEFLTKLAIDWQSFILLTSEVRQIIFEAISELGSMGPGVLRYRSEKFVDYFAEHLALEETKELSLVSLLREETRSNSES